MSKQYDLFGGNPPHVKDSDTSLAAAESMAETGRQVREKVFRHITLSGGSTCDEIELALNMRHQTASARVRELALTGRIRDSGNRRKTRSGRQAVVWTAPQ